MDIEDRLREALWERYREAETQVELSTESGVGQSGIARLLNKRRSMLGITVGTLLKLFPELELTLFEHERPSDEAMELAHAFDALPAKFQRELTAALDDVRKRREKEEATSKRRSA